MSSVYGGYGLFARGGSRGLRGGSHSQFKSRLGGWVTFAALGIPKGGHFRSFRSFRARCLSRAFATAFADFREPSARFGSYLRSTCASEAEAWTSGNQGCPLAIDCPAWVHFAFVKVIYVLTVMSYGDTRDPALHSTMMTRLTSKKRPSNQLTRLSVCDLSEVHRSKGCPLSTFRAWGGR